AESADPGQPVHRRDAGPAHGLRCYLDHGTAGHRVRALSEDRSPCPGLRYWETCRDTGSTARWPGGPVTVDPAGQAPDPGRIAGGDLGIIHPYAVAGPGGEALLVS